MAGEPVGVCPNCETSTGPVGQMCESDVCRRKGYAFIPRAWYESAKEFALRKQRPMDPLLGRSLDRYLLAGKLGEGGMGAVYLAFQRPLNREVALKVISGLEITQATIARFEREARAISVLDHPNIVKLYDYGVGELEFRVPYMALEYVKHGRTLRRALAQMREERAGAPIPGDVVLAIFRQLLHALSAAHGVGIIHRDMKPDNVMLAPVAGNPYFVKVLDFGLAKAVADVSGFDGTVSRAGQLLGTACYMAPEQAPRKGQVVVDFRADLYAVAVMLFEVFTGRRPFEGEAAIEILLKKVDPGYDPLAFPEASGLPRQLRDFLRRGMSADPEARFGSADEMLSALEGALSGRSATAVGIAPGHAWSSDDRPATPASEEGAGSSELRVRNGEKLEPTTRLWDYADAGRSDVATKEREHRGIRWRWVLVLGALLIAGAVAAGIWVMGGSGPGTAAEPVPQAAPATREPGVEPARVEEPVPAAVAEPARVEEPVPAAVAEPVVPPSNEPGGEIAPRSVDTTEGTKKRVPAMKPVPKPKAPEPAHPDKPRRL